MYFPNRLPVQATIRSRLENSQLTCDARLECPFAEGAYIVAVGDVGAGRFYLALPLGDRHSPKPDSDEVEDADGPRRHEIHQRDQKHAKNGIGRRLRYLFREIRRELDEKCPDEDARN
jgi:hypothetical protein